jgi:TRAP transporter TAXI family solute receptor
LSRQLLAAHDLTYDDVDEQFLSFGEAAAALKDRAIDAALISVGFPASSVLDATTTGGIELLPLSPEVIARMIEEYPYYLPGELPADAYPGVDEPIKTLAVMNWVVALEALDDDVVDHLLSVLSEEQQALIQVHPQAAQIDLNTLDSSPIPLHPAVEAWRAAGGN